MASYVFNSSTSGEKYNGKCLNVSDDSEWTPSVAEYPQDGTIDLSGGVAGRYIDTQWIAPQDEEWTMSGIYNVVMGVSYDMYSIHYKGNQTCDIYLGSNTVPIAISESDKPYTPPTTNWIIEEEPPAIIIEDDGLGAELLPGGDFSAGLPANCNEFQCTIDYSAETANFTFSDRYGGLQIVQGTIIEVGKTYRITFDVISFSSTGMRVGSASTYTVVNATGPASVDYVADVAACHVISNNDVNQTIEIDNLSIKEIL